MTALLHPRKMTKCLPFLALNLCLLCLLIIIIRPIILEHYSETRLLIKPPSYELIKGGKELGEQFTAIEHKMSTQLFHQVRILCLVLNRPNGTVEREVIIETWGKRCQILIFAVGVNQTLANISTINNLKWAFLLQLPMKEDKAEATWQKVQLSVHYVHKNFGGKFDWFMRIDDDAFVVMENLRLFLLSRDPQAPEVYGVDYKVEGGFVGTGAGLTISAQNFGKMVDSFKRDDCPINVKTHSDDVMTARCLRNVGIRTGDSRDAKKRIRFFPMNPQYAFNGSSLSPDFWAYSRYPFGDGLSCCADDFIAFHYISPTQMRMMEFLIYYMHPFSVRESWKRPETSRTLQEHLFAEIKENKLK